MVCADMLYVVHSAFDAYHRQLANRWPDTLLNRYNELPSKRGADDARRQCLARYLLNPSSGGVLADQPGGCAEDGDGSPLAKVRRVGDAGNGGVATPAQDTPIKSAPMQALTPQRSPAVLLATSVRSTGTPRIQLSPEPAQTDRRWAEVPWSQGLRESVQLENLLTKADAKAVKWYKAFAAKRASDPEYLPSRRGDDADLWQALYRYSTNAGSYRVGVPTLRLFALQPDMLGVASAKFYGEVSDVAPWRWTSRAAAKHHGIDSLRDVESVAHRTRLAAKAEWLDTVKFFYPSDQEDPRLDPLRVKRITQALSAWNDFKAMSLAHADSFSFAKERVFDFFACVTDDLSNLYLPAVCMPNFGNTCYLNAVVQALIHCKPWRLRNVST